MSGTGYVQEQEVEEGLLLRQEQDKLYDRHAACKEPGLNKEGDGALKAACPLLEAGGS